MKRWSSSSARLRLCFWLAGTAVCLSYYFISSNRPPRRTRVGVEHRLFGLGSQAMRLLESPSGGQWVLAPVEPDLTGQPYRRPPTWWQRVRAYQWPGSGSGPRSLTPLGVAGTWKLRGSSPSRIWHRAARGWLDEHRLWSSDYSWSVEEAWVLDRRNGRTRRSAPGELSDQHGEDEEGPVHYDRGDWEPAALSALSSALEELPAITDSEYDSYNVGQRGIYLVDTRHSTREAVALYAVSDELVPRILRLTVNARPLALSRDGRTLFFQRTGALWRLDLHKPLPALLDEERMPELPDPLTAPEMNERTAPG